MKEHTMTIMSLLVLICYLAIIGVVCWGVVEVSKQVPMLAPFRTVILVVVFVVAILILLQLLGHGAGLRLSALTLPART